MCFLWGTNSTFCPHSVFVCSVWFSHKTETVASAHCWLSSRYQATSAPQAYSVHVTLVPAWSRTLWKNLTRQPPTGHFLESDAFCPHSRYPIFLRFSLILSSKLCLDLPDVLILSGFLTRVLYVRIFHLSRALYMLFPFHPLWFGLVNNLWWRENYEVPYPALFCSDI
jgi:hypothetical protein